MNSESSVPAMTPMAVATANAADAPKNYGPLADLFVSRKQHRRKLRFVPQFCDKHRCEYGEKDFQFHVEGGSLRPQRSPNVPPK